MSQPNNNVTKNKRMYCILLFSGNEINKSVLLKSGLAPLLFLNICVSCKLTTFNSSEGLLFIIAPHLLCIFMEYDCIVGASTEKR